MKPNRRLICSITGMLIGLGAIAVALEAQAPDAEEARVSQLVNDVHRAILSLPEYGVFDHIAYGIRDHAVMLRGQASRPILKSSAENAVKRVKGVEEVRNEIEVLPPSPNDDRIRAAAYARIYGNSSLQRYTSNRPLGRQINRTSLAIGITNDPPIGWHAIHIVVKNGDITLYGVVDNEADYTIAGMQARMVPGAFSVFNDLEVAGKQVR